MERKFPYLRIRVTDGEVRKLPIRKKNPGELLGPLAGASITVTREDRYEAPYEGVISAAIRTVHGGRPPRPEPVRGPVVARITFGGGQSREWQISGYARVEAAVEAAEFNELAALVVTGPAVPGVPHPRRHGRLGGLIAGVLSVPCELCGAPPGCGCDSVSPVFAEMVRLAKSPPLVVHTGRMASAITAGAVSPARGSGAVPREPAACGRGRRGGSCQTAPDFPVRRGGVSRHGRRPAPVPRDP